MQVPKLLDGHFSLRLKELQTVKISCLIACCILSTICELWDGISLYKLVSMFVVSKNRWMLSPIVSSSNLFEWFYQVALNYFVRRATQLILIADRLKYKTIKSQTAAHYFPNISYDSLIRYIFIEAHSYKLTNSILFILPTATLVNYKITNSSSPLPTAAHRRPPQQSGLKIYSKLSSIPVTQRFSSHKYSHLDPFITSWFIF